MVCPVLFLGWKIIHKTKFHRASEIDLNRDQDVLAEYERNYVPIPPRYATPIPPASSMCFANIGESNFFEKILDKVFG